MSEFRIKPCVLLVWNTVNGESPISYYIIPDTDILHSTLAKVQGKYINWNVDSKGDQARLDLIRSNIEQESIWGKYLFKGGHVPDNIFITGIYHCGFVE